MRCDHCGDCYELLTDVRVLNTLANLGREMGRVGLRGVRARRMVSTEILVAGYLMISIS